MPATAAFFARYPNRWFVETGTWHGDGVQAALEAGFMHIVSIELSANLHAHALQRFRGDERVELRCGPSEILLPAIIRGLCEQATFWLDAHYSAGDTAHGVEVTPLLSELAAIADSPIKTHTLLIDDVRLFGAEFVVSLNQVTEAVKRINPAYSVSLEDSPHARDDILVVQVQ